MVVHLHSLVLYISFKVYFHVSQSFLEDICNSVWSIAFNFNFLAFFFLELIFTTCFQIAFIVVLYARGPLFDVLLISWTRFPGREHSPVCPTLFCEDSSLDGSIGARERRGGG